MRQITLNVLSFDELNEAGRQTAIRDTRELYYQGNDFAHWAIDDCYLFEPKHEELVNLFGEDFYEQLNKDNEYKDTPMIGNNRNNIYFDYEQDEFIDCEDALEVNNDKYFFLWLGIPESMHERMDYQIMTNPNPMNNNTSVIEFSWHPFNEEEQKLLSKATRKFDDHLDNVLERLKQSIEYRFTDEAIIEDLTANEYEYTENGKIYID